MKAFFSLRPGVFAAMIAVNSMLISVAFGVVTFEVVERTVLGVVSGLIFLLSLGMVWFLIREVRVGSVDARTIERLRLEFAVQEAVSRFTKEVQDIQPVTAITLYHLEKGADLWVFAEGDLFPVEKEVAQLYGRLLAQFPDLSLDCLVLPSTRLSEALSEGARLVFQK